MDRLAHASPAAGDDGMTLATARLEAKPGGRIWRSSWFAFIMVLSIGTLVSLTFLSGFEELTRLKRGRTPYRSGVKTQEEWEQRLARRVDPSKKIFLFSGTRSVQDTDVNRWLSERFENLPEDPAELEELWHELGRTPGAKVPESFQAQSKRIDPDNGLWALLTAEAGVTGGGGAYRGRRSGTGPVFSRPPWYAQSLSKLEEALAAPRIESYRADRTAERLRLLGPPRDLAELADLTGFAQRQAVFMGNSGNVIDIWIARAQELVSLNDLEGFRQWTATWDRRVMEGLRSPGPNANCPSLYHIERATGEFQSLALIVGAPDVEARMKKWQHEVNALIRSGTPAKVTDMELRIATYTGDLYYHRFGSAMEEMVTVGELAPGVKAEHAVADRFGAVAIATIFVVLSLVAFFEGWRRAPHLRGMAQGLMPLLRPVDYLWVGGLGMVLPLLWYVAWIRFTPLGFRDLAVGLEDFLPFVVRLIAILLFSLCMLLQVARWRVAKRGGFLGLRPAALWPGWIMAGIAAITVPVTGLARYWPGLDEIYYLSPCAVLGFPLLWLLWRGGSILFGPVGAALPGVMLSRFLLPVLVLGSLVLVGLTPFLKDEERAWMARDTLSGPDPSGWFDTKLQADIERYVRQRVLQAME
ncbi:hypothetical protein [Luteolibacter luteus]|uniref:Uncharacterized protein n=1 Tax=Luteolibacter luteus TaxID=2728835 RepID=A0A858RJR8_9BACT|nr:hypothetical protein [Luteolibacter luteus]QJE96303.1 hypothetical protein HHL09_11070 [Luteolibacter luteus]